MAHSLTLTFNRHRKLKPMVHLAVRHFNSIMLLIIIVMQYDAAIETNELIDAGGNRIRALVKCFWIYEISDGRKYSFEYFEIKCVNKWIKVGKQPASTFKQHVGNEFRNCLSCVWSLRAPVEAWCVCGTQPSGPMPATASFARNIDRLRKVA